MNTEHLIENWRKTRDSYRILLIALVFSGLANLVQAIGLINQKEITTMVPPVLVEQASVGHNFADSSYVEAWALYTSQTLGNVTPSSVRFVRKAIEPILSPMVYQPVMQQLEKQVEEIRDNHVVLYFEPRRILREKETEKIFVHGQSVLESPSGDRTRTERTYEFKFEVVNYLPSLTHVDTYKGKPRTQEELEMMKRLANERARRGGGKVED